MVLAVAAVGMASRCAAGTIDQQNLVGGADNPASTTFGESFTPTLTSIGYAEFDLSTAGSTLQLSLYNGTGSSCTLLGQSASDAIGTASFGIVHFDLLSSVTLTPGNSYTLLVSDSTGTFEGTYNPATRMRVASCSRRLGFRQPMQCLRKAQVTRVLRSHPRFCFWRSVGWDWASTFGRAGTATTSL